MFSKVFERLILSEIGLHCPPPVTGRPRKLSDAKTLAIIFSVLRSGMSWREIDCDVHYTNVLRRMHSWREQSVFVNAYKRALVTYKKLFPTKYYAVDSSYVKNAYSSECVGKNHTDRGRKALKLSIVVDHTGIPHGACCHPGNKPDVILLEDSITGMFTSLDALPMYADKGYDSKRNRQLCSKYGLKDRLMKRRCKTGRRANAKRVVVEHSFAWMKRYKRLIQLYEHSSRQFLTFVVVAFGDILGKRVERCQGME